MAGIPVHAGGLGKTAAEHPIPWSFKPLKTGALPKVSDTHWPQRPLDRFIESKMEAAGLKTAAPASPRVLVRRLYFDLIGLPPAPAQMTRAEAMITRDGKLDQDGVARLVDELLSSPHYGERWGRHWLDLARYTDKNAEYLDTAASAWLYRDWVVQALNEDMPYDRFIKRQLATDFMPDCGPKDLPALGFLGLSPTYFKELKLPPEIIKTTVADEWEEHVDALGRTFLGLTLACARCHDHKFDPISTADYYAIAGVFASVKITERPTMSAELWKPVKLARDQVAALEKAKTALTKKKPAPADFKDQMAQMEEKITSIKQSTPHYDVPMADAVEDAALFVVNNKEAKEGGTKLDYHEGMARDLELQKRGNPNDLGATVQRRFLTAFPTKTGKPRVFTKGSGRLELAEAIVEDAAPLTARVMVNRVWKHHFGPGLVDSPSEFGNTGDVPTHPALLDDLAAQFIAHGWSLKWLHREILLSAAWQQSSIAPDSEKRDPENRLYARASRRRLDFEAWRDSMLAVNGIIDQKMGGPSMALPLEENHRRTLYGTVYRDEMDAMLRIHDVPDPASHSPARMETITPLQSLFALNGPFMQQQADALGRLLQSDAKRSVTERVNQAYVLLFQRAPGAKELALATQFFSGHETDAAVWSEYAQALLSSNEFLFLD
jgi:hypothetical protein